MDRECDSIQLYRQCDRALEYYEKQHQDIQRHTLRYRRNSQADEHSGTLERIHSYLQNSDARSFVRDHLRIDEYISGEIIEAADAARGQESILLHRLVLALIWTKMYLLDKMIHEEIVELLDPMEREGIEFVYTICENEVRSVQRSRNKCVQTYTKNLDLSRDDLKRALIATEYAKDKRLNKFELQTDLYIKNKVEESMEEAWNNHLERLPRLQNCIANDNASIKRWKAKAELLRTILDNSLRSVAMESTTNSPEKQNSASFVDVLTESQGHITSTSSQLQERQGSIYVDDTDLKSSPPAIASTSFDVCNSPSMQSGSSTAGSIGLTSTSVRKAKTPIEILTPRPSSRETLCPQTAAENECPLSNTVFMHGKSHQFDSAPKPLRERMLNIVTSQPNSPGEDYRFSHNKPPTPTVRPSSADQDLWRRPFAGIDHYAQGLFARNSTTHVERPR